jgi:LEA14-like dessication related protein
MTDQPYRVPGQAPGTVPRPGVVRTRVHRRPAARLAFMAALALLVPGCSLFYQDPTVRFMDVRVVGLGVTSGTAELTLEVENPNRFALDLREFTYLLEVAEGDDRWVELARGEVEEAVRIGRRTTQEVILSVPFQYRGAGSAIRAWLDTGRIDYRFQGELTARAPSRTVTFPVRSQGTLVP